MNLQDFKRSIDLECFLLDLGYSLKKEKSSRRTHVYTNGNEHIIVNQKRDVKMYFKPDGDKGSIIDFLLNREELLKMYQGSIYSRIYQKLADYAQLSNRSSIDTLINFEQKIPFQPDNFKLCQDRSMPIFNYLRSRGINNETLHSSVFCNIGLNKGKCTNVAFPIYDLDRNIKGLDLRNFNFKSLAPGSDKTNGLWLSNFFNKIDEIIISESPIDSMSFHQLYREKCNDLLYISTSGSLTQGQIQNILSTIRAKSEINPRIKLNLSFDNDLAGATYTNKILLSIIEDKSRSPIHVTPKEKKYTGLTDKTFEETVNNLKLNCFINHTTESEYELLYSNDKKTLELLNRSLLSCITSLHTSIYTPILKDWNEELQSQNKPKKIIRPKGH